MSSATSVRVYLVGAGPGDSGLITVKGMQCLKKADVVVYDYLSDPSLLAYAPQTAEKIYVGKSASQHTMEQEEINALLVKKGLEGKITVRLKGGDPFVFGRGGEECDALRTANIPYEVVPGITSGIAAPAYAGIPVTHRNCASSMALITGNEDPTKSNTAIHWEHLAKGVDTLVFYMGVGNLPNITAELIKHGRSPETPVAVIRWGTKTSQRTIIGTLQTIVENVTVAGIKPPAITIVGDVVNLRDRLQWFENRPLFGKRIITTRSRTQASNLAGQLSELGAEVIELPTIEIVPVTEHESQLATEINNLDKYNWIVFTSPNGVDAFFDMVLSVKGDVRAIGNARIASIGPGTTAAIKKYHIKTDITAQESMADGLVESLKTIPSWNDVTVMIPRAEKARDILPDALTAWGAKVTAVTAYKNIPPRQTDPAILDDIRGNHYDLITFSSSSTFENFVNLFSNDEFQKIAPTLKAASIGPITTATIHKSGIKPLVEAGTHTIPGLISAIQEYFKP